MASDEAKVLSAVCKNKDMHVIIGEPVELFGPYGDVYLFMKDYYLKHRAVPDIAIIESQFGSVEFPETTGASAFYLDGLRDGYVGTRMEEVMLKSAKAKKDGMASADRLQRMLTSLTRLGQFTSSSRDLSVIDTEAAEEYFEKIRAISEENNGTPGISTGFDTIDSAYTTGLAAGHAILLMGYTGTGKSMWSALLGVNAWLQKRKVMVISLEMTPEEYRERVYAMMSKGMFKMTDLSRGNVDPDDFRTWSKREFDGATDFIIISAEGNSDMSPSVVQSKIDTYRPDIVILDYMQLMSDNAHSTNMTEKLVNMSREIKLMATSNAIPIVAITAVTDEKDDKRDAPPRLGMSAWAKGMEYDFNLIVAVHRHTDTDTVEVVGRKNRHGPLFDCFFQVDFDSGLWVERFDT